MILRGAKRVARTQPRRSPEASPEVILAQALLRCLGHSSLGRGCVLQLHSELSCLRSYIINYIIITRLVGVRYLTSFCILFREMPSPHTSADSSSQRRIQGANVLPLDCMGQVYSTGVVCAPVMERNSARCKFPKAPEVESTRQGGFHGRALEHNLFLQSSAPAPSVSCCGHKNLLTGDGLDSRIC